MTRTPGWALAVSWVHVAISRSKHLLSPPIQRHKQASRKYQAQASVQPTYNWLKYCKCSCKEQPDSEVHHASALPSTSTDPSYASVPYFSVLCLVQQSPSTPIVQRSPCHNDKTTTQHCIHFSTLIQKEKTKEKSIRDNKLSETKLYKEGKSSIQLIYTTRQAEAQRWDTG